MRKQRVKCLVAFVLVAGFGALSFPGSVSASGICSADQVDSFLKSSSLELGEFIPAGFNHGLHLAGGGQGGSGSKGGYKGSGRGHGYEGSKGSGGHKGSKGSGGYKDAQGKTGSTGSKGAQDELKVEKEKHVNSATEEGTAPYHVGH